MRTTADRIRHSILFEVMGVLTCAPLAAWALNKDIGHVASLSIAMSIIAMLVNYAFNYAFDILLVRMGRMLNDRPAWLRVIHAFAFEACLVVITVPLVAWWLNMNLWQAFLADIGFVVYFLFYAFVYNWAYDLMFPLPAQSQIRHCIQQTEV